MWARIRRSRTKEAAGAGTTAVDRSRVTALEDAVAGARVAVGAGTTAAGAGAQQRQEPAHGAGGGWGRDHGAGGGGNPVHIAVAGFTAQAALAASSWDHSRRQRPSRQWQGHGRRLWTRQCWWQRTGTYWWWQDHGVACGMKGRSRQTHHW